MGLFSEQGAESLHAHVRILEIRCYGVPNEEKKMKSVMQKHLYQVSPSLIALFPKAKKWSKRNSKFTKTSGQAVTVTAATTTAPPSTKKDNNNNNNNSSSSNGQLIKLSLN